MRRRSLQGAQNQSKGKPTEEVGGKPPKALGTVVNHGYTECVCPSRRWRDRVPCCRVSGSPRYGSGGVHLLLGGPDGIRVHSNSPECPRWPERGMNTL